MPSFQVVDLSPKPQEETNLEKIVGGFVKRGQEHRESDALADIYKQYQQDEQDIDKAYFNIESNPNISPTRRVEATKNLIQLKKQNVALQKQAMKQQQEVIKAEQDKVKEQQDVDNLKKAGASDEQIALFKASPVGGRTKVSGDIIESINRKKTPAGFISEDIVDYDQGLTPQERVERQEKRFTVQTPLVNENSKALSAIQSEGMSIDLLNELNKSGKVGQGIQNLNINPKTGDLFLSKAGTPEEQLFVKTVNDFTVKAKDSFGARVTNFELDRFMQRLPTLANSEEGRALILRQMKIVNEINTLEKAAIQKQFDKYGIRNIDYADAEQLAREEISPQKEELRKEFTKLESLAKRTDSEISDKARKQVPKGYTLMYKDGKYKAFKDSNVDAMREKEGWEVK